MRYALIILGLVSTVYSATTNITLLFEDMEIRAALRMLAQESGLNIVVSPQVTGKTSANFKHIAPELALKSMVQSAGYLLTEESGVYKVSVVPRKGVLRAGGLAEFTIKYANSNVIKEELLKLVPSLKDKIVINKETNSVFVRSNHPEFALIHSLIERLDAPPLQVMVEAKIFEVGAEESQKLGSKLLSNVNDGQHTGFETFNLEPVDKAIYVRSMNKDLEAYISALETKSDFNMLSSPKVIVVNNREALLETQAEVAYQDETITYTSAGQSVAKKLVFKNTGTKLKFIPHINEDGYITIDLYPEISTSVQDTATNYPLIHRTQVHTQVVVPDGQTFLLGGLLRDREENVKKKVPLLGDIPLLGWLFQRSEKVQTKKEVIIMITPTIMKENRKATL
jgi:type II secretory pathway component GspD/PulD (secretin)